MRKIIILISGLLLIVVGATAQIAINTDGSAAHSSAILDVSSTTKGMFVPRMARVQIEALANPANGLMVFDTDDGKFYIYITAKGVWRELEYATGTVTPPGAFTMSCSTLAVHGDYTSGVTLDASNNVTLDVDVTVTGDWSITTNTVNGYRFAGGGTFTSTGTQQVTLDGSGTPSAGETDNFTATGSNGAGTCSFSVKVIGTVTSAGGKIWMDRNLGASKVADSLADVDSYGDLYQWGRAEEGHEKRNSDTYTSQATTSAPNAGNSWDGKFITYDTGNYDWLQTSDDNLWQGVNGTNNPCPSGFRLPTHTEWQNEANTWDPQNDAGAYASPLKMPDAGWRYRDGTITNPGSEGNYWSSTINQNDSKVFILDFDNASLNFDTDDAYRGDGMSIRCIKD